MLFLIINQLYIKRFAHNPACLSKYPRPYSPAPLRYLVQESTKQNGLLGVPVALGGTVPLGQQRHYMEAGQLVINVMTKPAIWT